MTSADDARAGHRTGSTWLPLLGVIAAAAACGMIGVLIGLASGGLIPGITGWMPGGWSVPLANGTCGAALGTVISLGMYRAARRERRASDERVSRPAQSAAASGKVTPEG